MTSYHNLQTNLRSHPRRWLVTGVAGFIGSHLLETLLELGQTVVGLDNLSTGNKANLDAVHALMGEEAWKRFRFVEGDIRSAKDCRLACREVELVLHQAALGSVPRSIEDPLSSFECNVMGFMHIMLAARDSGVQRVVYASSSSVYGDHPELPKREENIGRPLSPYAATKLFDETIAEMFARCYGLNSIGLRYFNVFGPRQDPAGPYAAVIPKWIEALRRGETVCIFGDGETSRDFCFVKNAVQANLLAATTNNPGAVNQVYNIAANARMSLNQLYAMLRNFIAQNDSSVASINPSYQEFRPGDVRHSQADLTKASQRLGYEPTFSAEQGLSITVQGASDFSVPPATAAPFSELKSCV